MSLVRIQPTVPFKAFSLPKSLFLPKSTSPDEWRPLPLRIIRLETQKAAPEGGFCVFRKAFTFPARP
jgi:hypothetical protein